MIGTEYIDSTGLGVIVGGLKRCVAKDGLIAIALGQVDVFRIFNITGLSRVIQIFDELSAATAMALDPDSKYNDPPRAHQYAAQAGWFEIRIYTPDAAKGKALEEALFSLLERFDIEPCFRFSKIANDGTLASYMRIRESAGPVSLSGQLEALHRLIEKYTENSADLPINGRHHEAAANLMTILNETASTTMQIKTTLLVKSKKSILIRSFDANELRTLLYNNDFRYPAQILAAIRSSKRSRSKSKKT
jgi:hypothetical protein